jgi:hypothetical protein
MDVGLIFLAFMLDSVRGSIPTTRYHIPRIVATPIITSTPTTAVPSASASLADNSVVSITGGDTNSRKKERYRRSEYFLIKTTPRARGNYTQHCTNI